MRDIVEERVAEARMHGRQISSIAYDTSVLSFFCLFMMSIMLWQVLEYFILLMVVTPEPVFMFLLQMIYIFSCFFALFMLLRIRSFDLYSDIDLSSMWLRNRCLIAILLPIMMCYVV